MRVTPYEGRNFVRGCSVAPFHLEQGIYENVNHIFVRPDNWRSGNAFPSGPATRRIKRRDSHAKRSSPGPVTTIGRPVSGHEPAEDGEQLSNPGAKCNGPQLVMM